MTKNIDRESFKWGFLAQRCSFVIYITCHKGVLNR